jgi:hypothetical protein
VTGRQRCQTLTGKAKAATCRLNIEELPLSSFVFVLQFSNNLAMKLRKSRDAYSGSEQKQALL